MYIYSITTSDAHGKTTQWQPKFVVDATYEGMYMYMYIHIPSAIICYYNPCL